MTPVQKLTQKDVAILKLHQPEIIPTTIENCRRYFKKNRWLGTNNMYITDTCKKLETHYSATRINSKHLREYIAISAILHCFDSWKYLSKSINAGLCDDSFTATHLAYYSELRSAMSVLASQGIGVFNTQNFVFSSMEQQHLIKGRTHRSTWQMLQAWSETPTARNAIFSVVSPKGISLLNWFSEIINYTPATMNDLTKNLVKIMGFDLKFWVSDRQNRNEASYRPSIPDKSFTSFPDNLQQLEDIWNLLGNDFENLDRFLLKEILSLYQNAVPNFHDTIDTIFSNIQSPSDEIFKEFLLSNESNKVIQSAKIKTHNILSMQSRSIILLRISTGLIQKMFSELSITKNELEFWLGTINQNNYLYDPEIENFTDLYQDLLVFFDMIHNSPPTDFLDIKGMNAYFYSRVSCSELAFLWSVFH